MAAEAAHRDGVRTRQHRRRASAIAMSASLAAKLSHDEGIPLRLAATLCEATYAAAMNAWYRLYGKAPWPGYEGHGGTRRKAKASRPLRRPDWGRTVDDAVAETQLCRRQSCSRIDAHRDGECFRSRLRRRKDGDS